MNDWEFGLKRRFKMNVAEDQTWHVDVPGFRGMIAEPLGQASELSGLSVHSSTLSLRTGPDTGHVKAIFSEVCSKIIDLTRTQLAVVEEREGKKPSYILPVGGFGGNRHLKEQLSMSFKDIKLRLPSRPWSAICRGTVLKGLGHDLVVNHVSEYIYGLLCNEPFVEGMHLQRDRVFLKLPRIWVARDQMEWCLKKGEDVAKDAPVCHSLLLYDHEAQPSEAVVDSDLIRGEPRGRDSFYSKWASPPLLLTK
ncbi:MAG: hypothetical protein M1818_004223 [Claussenomyces sp. TS43310]|nr:MAG: hypothetical protein M1818_004223 [Claussenomyces sp. TS43310]